MTRLSSLIGVGKTCTLVQFTERVFPSNVPITTSTSFRTKYIDHDGKRIKLQIWDTAGQQSSRAITASVFRGAQGILLVYDIAERTSFDSIPSWLSQIKSRAEGRVSVVLIGNKADCDPRLRVVTYDEGDCLARQHDIPFVESSAKGNMNIDDIFYKSVTEVRKRSVERSVRAADSFWGLGETTAQMSEDEPPDRISVVMNAISRGDESSVMSFVTSGEDINQHDDRLWTAVMMAAFRGHTKLLGILVDAGADIEKQNEDGWTALMMACHPGHIESVKLLLDAKANIQIKNKIGATALMLGAMRGRVEVVKALLAAGADVNAKDNLGEPGIIPKPIVYESAHPYGPNIRDYIAVEIHGADSYTVVFDEQSCTELDNDYVIFFNGWSYNDVISGEVRYSGGLGGTDKVFPGLNGLPPLKIENKKFIIHFLTNFKSKACYGYKLTVTPEFIVTAEKGGWTALIWAAKKGRKDVIRLLVKAGAEVEVQGWDGRSPLGWAVERFHEGTAIALLQLGALVDSLDKHGVTPIEKAVDNKLEQFISEVIKSLNPPDDDADVTMTSFSFVWTYLLSTTTNHLEDICEVLDRNISKIRYLAEVNDKSGRTAIGIAQKVYKEAIMERLYFYKRFEFLEGPPAHKSATCILILATDHETKKKVALKFMAVREHFEREVKIRESANFDDTFVLNATIVFDGDENPSFLNEDLAVNLYPYCVVMPAAERNLQDIIGHEHISGRDWTMIATMCRELVEDLQHIHSKGFVHGDLKPMNIMRCEGRLRLIDLDGAANVAAGDLAGKKYSSAYLPPEMIAILPGEERHVDSSSANSSFAVVRKPHAFNYATDHIIGPILYDELEADYEQDIWSLGCTLYQLCTGECLFNADDESNMDQTQLRLLYEWKDELRLQRLAKIKHPAARNLISRFLSKCPTKRPGASQSLTHPFLTGKKSFRMVGDGAKFDVFLSYRVASDKDHACLLYALLTARGCRVFLDSECLTPGQEWEQEFCEAVMNSKIFVPLISRAGCLNFTKLRQDSPCDNFFLELNLALELKAMGLVEAIFPVLIGDAVEQPDASLERELSHDEASKSYTKFNAWIGDSCGDLPVEAVDEALQVYLDDAGLGVPLGEDGTVRRVFNGIMGHQGAFVVGDGRSAFAAVADTVLKINKLGTSAGKLINVDEEYCLKVEDPKPVSIASGKIYTDMAANVPANIPVASNGEAARDGNISASADLIDRLVAENEYLRRLVKLCKVSAGI